MEQGGVFRRNNDTHSRPRQGLNPFGTGRGLSTQIISDLFINIGSLNPFGTGRGFRLIHVNYKDAFMRFNPFRTGQGLSTEYRAKLDAKRRISIPLE